MNILSLSKKIILLCLLSSSVALATTKSDLQQQLQASELQLSELSQKITTVNSKLSNEKIKLEALRREQQPLLAQLAIQQKTLAEQMRLVYQLGQAQSLKTLLNPDDINTINRHLTYYHYLSDARVRLVAGIKQNIDLITANMKIINEHEQQFSDLLKEKHQHQNEQHQITSTRQQIVTQLGGTKQTLREKIATTLANQKTLQNTLSTLHMPQTPSSKNTAYHSHGKLRWPISGAIIASFGSWINNQRSPGVVIKAPEGTPVHAIYSGKVLFANWLRGFGLLIIIDHGDGYMSLYGRNRSLYAKVGDLIKPRTVIATIGNSGGYNKASLYFEMRENGKPINPQRWCR